MSEKYCIDQNHEGEDALPLDEFYANPRMADGHLKICITCQKRRATDREYRIRNEREAQGLSRTGYRRERVRQPEYAEKRRLEAESRSPENYHERSKLRREEESRQHAEGGTTSTVDEMVLCRIEQDNPCNFVGMIDGFLRQATPRPTFSRS